MGIQGREIVVKYSAIKFLLHRTIPEPHILNKIQAYEIVMQTCEIVLQKCPFLFVGVKGNTGFVN